eukprot:UC1_evm1s1173
MFSNIFGKSKKPRAHSLDLLMALYRTIQANMTVTPENSSLVVETLRSVAEVVIWGDQNDPRVFEYFMEKEILAYFKHVTCQEVGTAVHVQLLQTITLLFDNLDNSSSIWFLLSNNHINSIILHRFDFRNDEMLAYYISLLRTLALRCNMDTILFFFNEHQEDFPLYTEAIRFFDHRESMARVAVRTLTLAIFRINDPQLMAWLRGPQAPQYLENLVWFVGNESLRLDEALRREPDHAGLVASIVAEHVDQWHYMADVLSLNVEWLSQRLTQLLVERLAIPLYFYGITGYKEEGTARVRPVLSLYLLAQIFTVFEAEPLVNALAGTLLLGHPDLGTDALRRHLAVRAEQDDDPIARALGASSLLVERSTPRPSFRAPAITLQGENSSSALITGQAGGAILRSGSSKELKIKVTVQRQDEEEEEGKEREGEEEEEETIVGAAASMELGGPPDEEVSPEDRAGAAVSVRTKVSTTMEKADGGLDGGLASSSEKGK